LACLVGKTYSFGVDKNHLATAPTIAPKKAAINGTAISIDKFILKSCYMNNILFLTSLQYEEFIYSFMITQIAKVFSDDNGVAS